MAAKTPESIWSDRTYDKVSALVVTNTDPRRVTATFLGTAEANNIDDTDTWTPGGPAMTGVTNVYFIPTSAGTGTFVAERYGMNSVVSRASSSMQQRRHFSSSNRWHRACCLLVQPLLSAHEETRFAMTRPGLLVCGARFCERGMRVALRRMLGGEHWRTVL